ncbi:MAG: hypothetical protein M0Q13_13285 [Methanothrix sp.]|nr:hypothetical protein [Methanothrix sp.]
MKTGVHVSKEPYDLRVYERAWDLHSIVARCYWSRIAAALYGQWQAASRGKTIAHIPTVESRMFGLYILGPYV